MEKHLKFIMTATLAVLLLVSCSKKKDPEPYITFHLKGTAASYTYGGQFSRAFCDYSTNCCHFYYGKDKAMEYSIQIGIPGDAIVGHKYVNGEYRFVFRFYDGTGFRHDFSKEGICELTLISWDGPGGWATGIFSGKIVYNATDSLEITGGQFLARISTN